MSKTLLRHLFDELVLDKEQFEVITQGDSKGDMQVFKEILRRQFVPEVSLLRAVCVFFELPFIESIEGLSIDLGRVERLRGLKEMKERLYAPIKGSSVPVNTVLTTSPFETFGPLPISITTRDNIAKLLHNLDHGAPVNLENPDEQLTDMISNAVTQRASDIHIYWDPVEQMSVTKFRVDGNLMRIAKFCVADPDLVYHRTLVNIIYGDAHIDASQYGDLHDSSFVKHVLHRDISIRLSSVPLPEGASVVLRLLYPRHEEQTVPLERLGFSQAVTETLKAILRLPDGIVLVSGPTGSGKTTTLYSLLSMKTKEAVNVVSIEDPVEVRLPDVRQVEVSPKKNITFASAIRSFLRHDPDVMLIGEIRDKETAQEAIRASQTGHLVFSTIHTNTACGVIARLVDLGSSEEFIASALRAVISQRLVRALCPNCRKKVVAPPHLSMIEYVYQPVGCDRCEGEGYKGRIVLWELLLITDTVRQAILRKVYADEDLMLKESGTESMQEVAQESLRLGRTSLEEVERFVVMGSLAGRVFSSGHFVREGV